jgi:septal ring factor EnvC (AmiA/AmiB activator)
MPAIRSLTSDDDAEREETELALQRHQIALLQRELAEQQRHARTLEASLKTCAKVLRPFLNKDGRRS